MNNKTALSPRDSQALMATARRAASVIQKLKRALEERDAEAQEVRSVMERAGRVMQKLAHAHQQRETEVRSGISRSLATLESMNPDDIDGADEQKVLALCWKVLKQIDGELNGISRSRRVSALSNPGQREVMAQLDRATLQSMFESRGDLTVEIAALLRLLDRLEAAGVTAWPPLPLSPGAEWTTERSRSVLARYQRTLEDLLSRVEQ